ncbi:MAG: pyridoxal-phosphate dependent enzyme [Rhodospirillales bacterium]|nr:pyridoxal-phosphate dependent enzyme [Rhodospirillales bacterium]
MSIGLECEIVNREAYSHSVERLRKAGVKLPKISQLADPVAAREEIEAQVRGADPDAPDARNLFRVHWHNGVDRKTLDDVPGHVVLPSELTGVEAKIVVAVGNRFPMVRAHKVLAAYGCLVPRLISGQFDPTHHRAVWPSTGNYCRGGVAISRILDCRSVAVLPEGMSRERFLWLEDWVTDPADIVRTYGTESNVKEIYDACNQMAESEENVILNQFNEFGNYIVHRAVTGPALERIFNAVNTDGKLKARAFVSASGSGGTLAAGDYLKQRLGAKICAVEALECPTLLYNGYGEHNIQGIGDKHVPYIHNVLNTDYVIGVSDKASDALNLVFNTTVGRSALCKRTGLGQETLGALADLGLSSIANVLGAIKMAKYMGLGANDVVLSVATDGAEMYGTELNKAQASTFGGTFDELAAAEAYGRYMLGTVTDHTHEQSLRDRERVFNLGYYTWVEQQGAELAAFDARRDPSFWDNLMDVVPAWDRMIDDFNKAAS